MIEHPKYKNNPILNLTFNFSLEIVKYTEKLEILRRYNVANQLFRSGTSVGANVNEAQNAESKKDFIHKLKISAKEAEETEYWLMICENSENYPPTSDLLVKIIEIQKILNKIIGTSKRSMTN